MEQTWLTALVAILGALTGGGVAARVYKGARVVKDDLNADRKDAVEERRNDHTVEFAGSAYKSIIADYKAEIGRKNDDLNAARLQIASLTISLEKSTERIHNMLRRQFAGRDILQDTDIGSKS